MNKRTVINLLKATCEGCGNRGFIKDDKCQHNGKGRWVSITGHGCKFYWGIDPETKQWVEKQRKRLE